MSKIETEVLHKEIDLIQACITRMAHNSFLIKGWAVSIVAVVLALAEKANNPALLSAILLIPLFSFWYLDAFFLQNERMYRKMYTWVLSKRKTGDEEMLYDLNPTRFKDQVDSRKKIMWSITLRCFYGIPVLIVTGIILSQIAQGVVTCYKNHVKTVVDVEAVIAPAQPKIPKLVDESKSNASAFMSLQN